MTSTASCILCERCGWALKIDTGPVPCRLQYTVCAVCNEVAVCVHVQGACQAACATERTSGFGTGSSEKHNIMTNSYQLMPVSLNINNRPTLWLSRLPERTQAIKLADLKINNGFQWRRGRSIYIWGALLPSPCGLLIIREACHSTIGNHSHARILICAWEWLPMYCHLCPIEFCTGFMVHSSYLSHLFPHYDSHP